MASIREIADRAGVSISTVSRVLNGSARVDDDKKARVAEAMAFYDYAPSQFGRALRRRKSAMVALVVPSASLGVFELGFLRGAASVVMENGCSLVLICDEVVGDERPAFISAALERRVDALLFALPPTTERLIDSLKVLERNGIPFCHVGRHAAEGGASVYAKYEDYTLDNLVYLYERGHDHIVLFHSAAHGEYVRRVLDQAQRTCPGIDVLALEMKGRNIADQLGQVLSKHMVDGPYTAMTNLDSEDLPVLLSLLPGRGIRVPDDLSIIVTENSEDAHRDIYPGYTARVVPSTAMGGHAASMLFDMLNGKLEGDGYRREFETAFVPRCSVKMMKEEL